MKNILLALLSICLVFTSCSSDDDSNPVDLSMKDLSVMVGKYEGICTIRVADKVKTPLKEATDFSLFKTTDPNVLVLSTSEFGLMNEGDRVRNVKYTSQAREACSFTIAGFSTQALEGGSIPTYLKTWFGADYTTIDKVDLIIEGSTANCTLASDSKDLKVEFKGKAKIYATVKNEEGEVTATPIDEYSFTYTYEVSKK